MPNRRELLALLAGVPLANLVGCNWGSSPIEGELLSPSFETMHRFRDGWRPPAPTGSPERISVTIIGGGIAGLSAAWQLQRSGIDDFVILELDSQIGGTARFGEHDGFRYPWAAHYVPVPTKENRRLIELFKEMGIVTGETEDGNPIVSETVLCRDPQERVFVDDHWIYGLYPAAAPSDEDKQQLERFRQQMRDFANRRDDQGRRLFAIPMASGSDNPFVRKLDEISMAEWMNRQSFTSPSLRWLVDYGCRDDYGLLAEQTSAWAGIFYFASRWQSGADESQEVMTWPEGNGRIVEFLSRQFSDRIRLGNVVTRVHSDPRSGLHTQVFDSAKSETLEIVSNDVIFAAPQFVAKRLVDGFEQAGRDVSGFQYGSWIVANVSLNGRPAEQNTAMCWDNVIAESPALGYVTSTHQQGIDHGPTVLTWYRPLTDLDPRISRAELMRLTWDDWSRVIVSDLQKAHPGIRKLIKRIDVMRWGHAMIQPRTGFIWGGAREKASQSINRIHFAASDLSGVALMEEAFDRGTRAADRVVDLAGQIAAS
ncbi:FAD-dependent oxidoreductase [Stieleria sp. JC731]|uniref:flavin monoamine oxidase family protein n=1 Tax=Pirellulaceae TaxID=2691357 RepID=UPI001E2E413E|nr:FAD-dependent oxidoreductase [Stieleria sp. JC731]MCC9604195.1 FAD-dependent oxidoreductase [Stieleria sp. JC731]